MGCKNFPYCQEWKLGACLSCPDRPENERVDTEEDDEEDVQDEK